MVERYEMKAEIRFIHGSPNADGKWVKYSDYAALESELSQTRRKALEEAATHARCAFDDRPRADRGIDWTDGFDDGTKASSAAIRALIEKEEK